MMMMIVTMMTTLLFQHGPLGLASTVSACADQQFGTNYPQDLRSTDTRKQFKRSLKGWLFECVYGRRSVW